MNKLPKICGFLAALFIALHAFSVSAEIAPVYIHEETSGNLTFSANVFLPEKQLYEVFKVEKQIWNGDEILALLRPRDYGSWTKEERKLATPDTFYSNSSDAVSYTHLFARCKASACWARASSCCCSSLRGFSRSA